MFKHENVTLPWTIKVADFHKEILYTLKFFKHDTSSSNWYLKMYCENIIMVRSKRWLTINMCFLQMTLFETMLHITYIFTRFRAPPQESPMVPEQMCGITDSMAHLCSTSPSVSKYSHKKRKDGLETRAERDLEFPS